MSTDAWRDYKIETAHRWLDGIRRQGIESQRLCALVEDLRYKATGLTAIDYAAHSPSQGPNKDAIPNAISVIQTAIAHYTTALAELTAAQHTADLALTKMDDTSLRAALTYHYLLGLEWCIVAKKMHYSESGLMKLRKRALAAAYDVMPLSERDPLPKAI